MSFLQMSFSGAVFIIAVVMIRAVTINRLPKKTFLILWEIALFRLLVPFSVPSMFSFYTLISPGRIPSPAISLPAAMPSTTAITHTPSAPVQAAAQLAQNHSPTVSVWGIVWCVGMMLCIAFFAVSYGICLIHFRASLPVHSDCAEQWLKNCPTKRKITIRQSDRISAPLTYGILRPVILLPKTTDWDNARQLQYVITHEYIHIRRFDTVTKLVSTAALCIHWFNPFVWVMYALFNRDLELACDESVIRLFGQTSRSEYARLLISLEARKSGLLPFCSSFSKNAIEERIIAIMKNRKNTTFSTILACLIVLGMVMTFATSAKASSSLSSEQDQTQYPQISAAISFPQLSTAIQEETVLSYVNPHDGKTYYSTDGGITFEPMTDEEYTQRFSAPDVEWWTAEEYAAWLEQEKTALQSIIGERGWNPTDGWYTWTQELVDETIAKYEQTLKDIQAGQKISKPMADGDTVIQFGFDPCLTGHRYDNVLGSINHSKHHSAEHCNTWDTVIFSKDQANLSPELLADYEAHGMTYDAAKNAFYFDGKLVRYFFDGYTLENGVATIYDHVNEHGVVDVHTVRQATRNADGSIDPGGKLAGIEAYSQEEFDSRVIMNPAMIQEATTVGFVGSNSGTTFEERFEKYRDFGITYVEAPKTSGRGNVYLSGQLVSRFADVSPDGSAFSFTSADIGGITVQTIYDDSGNLVGVESVQ